MLDSDQRNFTLNFNKYELNSIRRTQTLSIIYGLNDFEEITVNTIIKCSLSIVYFNIGRDQFLNSISNRIRLKHNLPPLIFKEGFESMTDKNLPTLHVSLYDKFGKTRSDKSTKKSKKSSNYNLVLHGNFLDIVYKITKAIEEKADLEGQLSGPEIVRECFHSIFDDPERNLRFQLLNLTASYYELDLLPLISLFEAFELHLTDKDTENLLIQIGLRRPTLSRFFEVFKKIPKDKPFFYNFCKTLESEPDLMKNLQLSESSGLFLSKIVNASFMNIFFSYRMSLYSVLLGIQRIPEMIEAFLIHPLKNQCDYFKINMERIMYISENLSELLNEERLMDRTPK